MYYSEPLARWPVREITRPGDNKSDPNIETGTYGLFSTCEPGMRNRIVHDGAATIFFLTTRKRGEGRVLSGYYHVGWYTEEPKVPSTATMRWLPLRCVSSIPSL